MAIPLISDELRNRAADAAAAAWGEGCPVATPPHDKVVEVCIRRCRSFGRRGVAEQGRGEKIHDIALGLIAAFEASPKLVGPLIIDYEYLAGRVLDALETPDPPTHS